MRSERESALLVVPMVLSVISLIAVVIFALVILRAESTKYKELDQIPLLIKQISELKGEIKTIKSLDKPLYDEIRTKRLVIVHIGKNGIEKQIITMGGKIFHSKDIHGKPRVENTSFPEIVLSDSGGRISLEVNPLFSAMDMSNKIGTKLELAATVQSSNIFINGGKRARGSSVYINGGKGVDKLTLRSSKDDTAMYIHKGDNLSIMKIGTNSNSKTPFLFLGEESPIYNGCMYLPRGRVDVIKQK